MQVWTDRLIRARIEEAPPRFSKPTLRQLQSADQKMFMELADQIRSGIQKTGTGRPVEAVFEAVINSAAVTCLMQPMPGASVKSQFGGGDKQDSDPNKWRPSPYKGKGKGKGKNLACLLSLSDVDPIPMVAFPFAMGSILGLARRRCRMGNVQRACMFAQCLSVANTILQQSVRISKQLHLDYLLAVKKCEMMAWTLLMEKSVMA